MIRLLTGAALAALLSASGAAWAQPGGAGAPGAEISIAIGPKLQDRAGDLGEKALQDVAADLRDDVKNALKHVRGEPPVRVDLVIEDAVPNRPTLAQLGRNPDLSFVSRGLGGARISGQVTYAGGEVRPVREQFFETDLRNDVAATTWYDADRAFDDLAQDLARGRLPDHFQGPGPTGEGRFGYAWEH